MDERWLKKRLVYLQKEDERWKKMQTLVLPTNPTGARKEMKAAEMDAINSWKGKMHVTKLLLK